MRFTVQGLEIPRVLQKILCHYLFYVGNYFTSLCRWRLVEMQTLFNQSLHGLYWVEKSMVRTYYSRLLMRIRSLHTLLGLFLV